MQRRPASDFGPSCDGACGTTCPKCEGKGLELETPPRLARRRPRPDLDSAERQADEVGERIGDELRNVDAQISAGGLPKPVQAVAETHLEVDLDGTELRDDADGQALARRERAFAVTEGSRISFARGRLEMATARGRSLLGHELVHVAQQRASGITSRQRNGEGESDDQLGAGPCEIIVETLTNQGLLTHLNNTRLFLHEHEPDDDGYYDWANLFRRLTRERRRRVADGHVWLHERGLNGPPPVVYAIDGGEGLYLTVRVAAASEISGRPAPSDETFVSSAQLQSFLQRHRVRQVNIEELLADPSLAGESRQVELNPWPQTRTYTPMYLPAFQGPEQRPPGVRSFEHGFSGPLGAFLDAHLSQGQRGAGAGFGSGSGEVGIRDIFTPVYGQPQTVTRTPSSGELVRGLESWPDSYTAEGLERIVVPGSASSSNRGPVPEGAGYGPMLMGSRDRESGSWAGVSGLAFAGQSPVNMPNNATGVIWEGSHAVDFVVVNGRLMTGGFRAELWRHGVSTAQRKLRADGGEFTASLNRGTPGSYANDALFPYMPNAVAIYRADGTPATAEEVARLMADARVAMAGEEYRYSTPPRHKPAYDRAFGDQGPDFCPPGARSCINFPMAVHEAALGGDHMVIPQEDGSVIRLSDPHQASASNMDKWVDLPESFFTERGLVRVKNLTGNTWRGAGVGAGLAGVVSLVGDIHTGLTTDETPRYLVNAGINTTIGGGTIVAENWATNSLSARFISAGASPTAGVGLSRIMSGTGLAAIAAPVATGLVMAFDDNEYTNIDYAAKMGRSGVSGSGGALAAGLTVALWGSEAPGLGNAAGFIVGVSGYYLTDWWVGDDVEEGIRDALGEQGCVDGIGPGR